MARSTTQRRDKGVSLARFPALVVGSLLLAFGLLAFLKNGDTPTGGFPDATVDGTNFLGFEVNGWTAFFTATAGGLLMFGAAQHLLAKTMSLIVGLALGACSVIALVDGRDVLGLAAANGWTKLGWGAAAAFLLINTLLPRKGGHKRGEEDVDRDGAVTRPLPAERVEREPVATRPVRTEPVEIERRDDAVRTEPVRTERVGIDRSDDGVRLDDAGRGRSAEPKPGRDGGSVAEDALRGDRRPEA